MDFRKEKVVAKEIGEDYMPLKIAGGYDHNWVLNGTGFRKVASAESEETGIKMEVYTDLPGIQFYSGNFLAGSKGKDGAVYEKVTSTNNYSKDSYIAGQIIKIAKNKYSGVDQYVYIQNALTCYFRGKASVNRYKDSRDTSLCKDSKVKSLINTAKKYVGEYQFNEGSKTSKLPKLTISTASQVISTVSSSSASQFNYTSSTIKISGLNKENYGGNRKNYYSSSVPKYTLNISGGVSGSTIELCSSNKCYSNGATDLVDGDYILRIKNGGSKGGKVVVSINGDNKSKYPSTNIWKCKSKCGTSAQVMQTYVPSVDVTRDISATQTFNYSAIGKYSALIEKVDESGNALKNATLKLYIADSSGNKIGNDLCSTNTPGNETSCSATELTEMNNYKEGNQLCYTEEVSPSGYKNIGTKCYPISLKGTGANATKYYEYHKNGDEWKETEILSGGDKVFQNYKTFAKGDNISAVNVFNVKNGKKIYSDVEKIYEYKYVVGDKEKVFYRLSDIPKDSSGKYFFLISFNPTKMPVSCNVTDDICQNTARTPLSFSMSHTLGYPTVASTQ